MDAERRDSGCGSLLLPDQHTVASRHGIVCRVDEFTAARERYHRLIVSNAHRRIARAQRFVELTIRFAREFSIAVEWSVEKEEPTTSQDSTDAREHVRDGLP